MNSRIVSMSALVLAASMMAASAFACSVMGPGHHVGKQVTQVDREHGSFTIIDAETNGPIEFSAAQEVLNQLNEGPGPVLVTYEEHDGKLIATDISF